MWKSVVLVRGQHLFKAQYLLELLLSIFVVFIGFALREKCPNTRFFLLHIFPHLDWIWRDSDYLSVYRVSLCIQSEFGKIRTRKNSVFGHFSHGACVVLGTGCVEGMSADWKLGFIYMCWMCVFQREINKQMRNMSDQFFFQPLAKWKILQPAVLTMVVVK